MKTKVCSGLLESLVSLATTEVEEDRHLHNPRPLQDQDSHEACHQGRSEDGLRSGDQGESEASTDCCEGLPSRCSQGSDLSRGSASLHIVSIPETSCRGNPMELVWVSLLMQAVYMCRQAL